MKAKTKARGGEINLNIDYVKFYNARQWLHNKIDINGTLIDTGNEIDELCSSAIIVCWIHVHINTRGQAWIHPFHLKFLPPPSRSLLHKYPLNRHESTRSLSASTSHFRCTPFRTSTLCIGVSTPILSPHVQREYQVM